MSSDAKGPLELWTSGLDLHRTGVGVIQRKLIADLKKLPGWSIRMGPSRPPSALPLNRVRFKLQQFLERGSRTADVRLVMTTPAPLLLRQPYVLVVYDLRWLRTAPALKRAYRAVDLRRALRGASSILVISERTRAELVRFEPTASTRTAVMPLGPGQCEPGDFTEGAPGRVLLVGSAPHKRNRQMIEALGMARVSWFKELVCVNVHPDDVAFAVEQFGEATVRARRDVDQREMVAEFQSASVYACLSIEEGFGLPFIEALCAGTQVVAVDQPLTRELLGDAGVLLMDGDTEALAAQLSHVSWPEPDVRRRRAERYSWAETTRVVVDTIQAAIR